MFCRSARGICGQFGFFQGISGLAGRVAQNCPHFIPFPRKNARLREPETLQAQSPAPKRPGILIIIIMELYGNGGRTGPQGFRLSLEELKRSKQVQPKGTSSSLGTWASSPLCRKRGHIPVFPSIYPRQFNSLIF